MSTPSELKVMSLAMVTERRAVARRSPDRAYGMLSLTRRDGAEENEPVEEEPQ
jgi:hypothetical protein